MTSETIDGKQLVQIFSASALLFEQNVEYINSLNVFPVPDGDTGTNMNLTVKAGEAAVARVEEQHFGKVIKMLSRGMLLGARGNSGVILSQIWRGMSQQLEQKAEISTMDFAEGLQQGAEVAYRSVMKPVEGTILTVIRETAQDAIAFAVAEKKFVPFLEKVLIAANSSLDNTPNLLPVLKEVGAVDSGGQGLVTLLEGMLRCLRGETNEQMVMEAKKAVKLDLKSFEYEDIHTGDEFGFCTEFILRLHKPELFDELAMRNELSELGESLVLVHDEEIAKVHIHTETPIDVFTKYATLGEYLWLKAENMQEQVEERQAQNNTIEAQQQIKTAIIAIASGEGVKASFLDMGATHVVDGGQTANPSTQDILSAVEAIHAENYIILPNNSNIILAAEQVRTLSDKNIVIVPSKTIPQGLAALLAFTEIRTIEENVAVMTRALASVISGEVTTAVRDTVLGGRAIQAGSYLSISEKEIVASEHSLLLSIEKLLDHMIGEDAEIVTLIEGQGVSQEEKDDLLRYIATTYPDVEVEYIEGKQLVYFYLVAVE